MSEKKKLINISESTIKGSKKTSVCPNCGGKSDTCDMCYGSGEVSMNKIHRLKEHNNNGKNSDKT
jgi:hypothetical protein